MIDPRERYAIIPAGIAGVSKFTVIDVFASEVVDQFDTWGEAENAVRHMLDRAGIHSHGERRQGESG